MWKIAGEGRELTGCPQTQIILARNVKIFVFRTFTLNMIRLVSLRINVRNAKYFVFQTFTRDAIRTSVNFEGGGAGGFKTDEVGRGCPKSKLFVGRP